MWGFRSGFASLAHVPAKWAPVLRKKDVRHVKRFAVPGEALFGQAAEHEYGADPAPRPRPRPLKYLDAGALRKHTVRDPHRRGPSKGCALAWLPARTTPQSATIANRMAQGSRSAH